jgi:uncharacterized RDD family membrane protein YckC
MSESENYKLANQGQRILNAVIDMIAFFIVYLMLILLSMALGFEAVIDDEEAKPLAILVCMPVAYWGYYIFFETMFGWTLGKLISKTRVIKVDGTRPKLLRIIGRTLSRSIPFEYITFFVMEVGVHDLISGTRVIRKDSISNYEEPTYTNKRMGVEDESNTD